MPEFDPSLSVIVEHLGDLIPGSLVLIDGPSGTGKSTVAHALSHSRESVTVVHMDDLYPGWNGLDAGIENLHEWILRPRTSGQDVSWPRFDWSVGEFGGRIHAPSHDILIVEGCGALGGGAHALADLSLWVSADDEVRRRRALDRNPAENFAPHWQEWEHQFARYVARENPELHASMHVRALG